MSRMVAAGELHAEAGRYRLAGRLVERSLAQEAGRRPRPRPWGGDWQVAVVTSDRRPAAERAQLRSAMARLHLAEWREGVWLRPANLGPPERLPDAASVADGQCRWLTARLDGDGAGAGAGLAAELWDLDGWAAAAGELGAAMAATRAVTRHRGQRRAAGRLPGRGRSRAPSVGRPVAARRVAARRLAGRRPPGSYDGYQSALQDRLRTWFRAPPAAGSGRSS